MKADSKTLRDCERYLEIVKERKRYCLKMADGRDGRNPASVLFYFLLGNIYSIKEGLLEKQVIDLQEKIKNWPSA